MAPDNDDGKIYGNYFDERGNGPTTLEVVPNEFKGTPLPVFGIGFKLADDYVVTSNTPIGGGIGFYRDGAAKLHASLSEWLAANPAPVTK